MKSPIQLQDYVKSASHKNQDEYFRQINSVNDHKSQKTKPPGALSDESFTDNESNQQYKTNQVQNIQITTTDETKIVSITNIKKVDIKTLNPNEEKKIPTAKKDNKKFYAGLSNFMKMRKEVSKNDISKTTKDLENAEILSNPSSVQQTKTIASAPAPPRRYNTFVANDNVSLTPKFADGDLPKPITRVGSSLNAGPLKATLKPSVSNVKKRAKEFLNSNDYKNPIRNSLDSLDEEPSISAAIQTAKSLPSYDELLRRSSENNNTNLKPAVRTSTDATYDPYNSPKINENNMSPSLYSNHQITSTTIRSPPYTTKSQIPNGQPPTSKSTNSYQYSNAPKTYFRPHEFGPHLQLQQHQQQQQRSSVNFNGNPDGLTLQKNIVDRLHSGMPSNFNTSPTKFIVANKQLVNKINNNEVASPIGPLISPRTNIANIPSSNIIQVKMNVRPDSASSNMKQIALSQNEIIDKTNLHHQQMLKNDENLRKINENRDVNTNNNNEFISNHVNNYNNRIIEENYKDNEVIQRTPSRIQSPRNEKNGELNFNNVDTQEYNQPQQQQQQQTKTGLNQVNPALVKSRSSLLAHSSSHNADSNINMGFIEDDMNSKLNGQYNLPNTNNNNNYNENLNNNINSNNNHYEQNNANLNENEENVQSNKYESSTISSDSSFKRINSANDRLVMKVNTREDAGRIFSGIGNKNKVGVMPHSNQHANAPMNSANHNLNIFQVNSKSAPTDDDNNNNNVNVDRANSNANSRPQARLNFYEKDSDTNTNTNSEIVIGNAISGISKAYPSLIRDSKNRMEEIVSDSPGLSEISAQDGGYGGRTSTPNLNKRKKNSSNNSHEFKIIRKQIGDLEKMYQEILKLLEADRSSVESNNSRNSSSSITSTVSSKEQQRNYKHGHRYQVRHHSSSSRSSDLKQINHRFNRLENNMTNLVKTVAHISTEIRSIKSIEEELYCLRNDLNELRFNTNQFSARSQSEPNFIANSQAPTVTQPSSNMQHTNILPQTILQMNYAVSAHNVPQTNYRNLNTDNKNNRLSVPSPTFCKRLQKLTKFFGEEPPLLRIFLHKLGYEIYAKNFENERITIAELPFCSEERLKMLGIPLGPRLRILQEAQLCLRQEFNLFTV